MAFPQRHSSSSSSSGSSSSSNSSSSSSSSGSSSSSSDEEDEQISEETKNLLLKAKKDYRDLKGKLFQAIKENEILTDELRRHQRKLLRLNRDKYFLFERLLAYEKPPAKQSGPKEERIEIVDGVPKVVKVGKKRGPKPKKKEAEPPAPFMMEPGSSLLKIKSSGMLTTSSPVRKQRGSKKNNPQLSDDNDGSASECMSPSSSSLAISFSPGFSKTKAVPSLKRQHVKQQRPSKNSKKLAMNNHHQEELSNSNTQDTVLSYKSDSGAPPSDFFRHDSFSHEMPENLFDD